MSERCPNCKIIDSSWHNGFSKSGPKIRHCRECGTQWQEDYPEGAKVPRRSQPVEVLELPDAEGKWFQEQRDGTWDYISVVLRDGLFRCYELALGCCSPITKGRYVRALPPIVSPVTRDEDAESLRTLAKWFDKEDREGRFGRFPSGEVQRNLRRIADRLDQAKERG